MDNRSLGRLVLDKLLSARRGELPIEVTYTLNVDSELEVKAREMSTGRESQLTVKPSTGMSPADLEEMWSAVPSFRLS